ncbi:caspase family protein [Prosthecomicrobium sp. N25]|uniref:caspase family protein n=1 Tax=Prosthecomicrobium sp. N25 TaxID=3129254 RepID=UPI003076EC56
MRTALTRRALLAGAALGLAGGPGAGVPAGADPVGRRVALVVGNAAYARFPALKNPRADAEDVAAALRALGFETAALTDLDRDGFAAALGAFASTLAGADVALFFFAGHAIVDRGRQYLVPVDAAYEDDAASRRDFVETDAVRDLMAAVRGVRILVLDACRNEPLRLRDDPGGGRAAPRPASGPDAPRGTVTLYATAGLDVAEDGDARNSPFTAAFLARLPEPDLEILPFFRAVGRDVTDRTGGRQVPELAFTVGDAVRLNPSGSDAAGWARVGASGRAADLRAFLALHPASPFVDAARRRLADLSAGN